MDTVIFDVGMVLVDFCWEECLVNLGFSPEVREAVANATVCSDVWKDLDRSERKDEDILRDFISRAPQVEKEIRCFFEHVDQTIRVYADSEKWLRNLKARGYRVYILSNYAERTYQLTKEKMTFLNYMDGAVFSFQEKKIKPERGIYECLLERYAIKPERAVFLDDLQANLDAAAQLGIHTILVKDREKAKKELEDLLERVQEK